MPRWIKKQNRDANEPEIVNTLSSIPGVQVLTNMDDIMVGYSGINYWFEIKTPNAYRKDGKLKKGSLTPAEQERRDTWPGHYAIIKSADDAMRIMGIL